jgi:hypothetical protein
MKRQGYAGQITLNKTKCSNKKHKAEGNRGLVGPKQKTAWVGDRPHVASTGKKVATHDQGRRTKTNLPNPWKEKKKRADRWGESSHDVSSLAQTVFIASQSFSSTQTMPNSLLPKVFVLGLHERFRCQAEVRMSGNFSRESRDAIDFCGIWIRIVPLPPFN